MDIKVFVKEISKGKEMFNRSSVTQHTSHWNRVFAS